VQDDPAAKRELPAGDNSVYLHNAGEAAAAAGSRDVGEAYRHTYVVFDTPQVLPRYVVHFAYHPRERAARAPMKPINLAEIKAKVADALSLLGPAAPAATEKMLSDIGDAYEAAISASSGGDPLLEDRKRGIRDTLKALDDKLAGVQANSAAVEEALYQKLQEALYALQDETQRKMNVLLSEELELRRQLQQIEWSESFIGVMQDTLPPMSFIAAWERHAALRSQLYAQLSGAMTSRALEEVHADLRLVGHIEVVSEHAVPSAAAAAAAAAASMTTGGAASRLPHAAAASSLTLALPAPPGPGATGGAGGGYLGATAALRPAVLGAGRGAAAPEASLGATGGTGGLWSAIVREGMGLPAPGPGRTDAEVEAALLAAVMPPLPSAAAGGAGRPAAPPATVEQAKALLALAKADVAAVERAMESAPLAQRPALEAARLEAAGRVVEAEAAYAGAVREEANAYLARKDAAAAGALVPVPATMTAAAARKGAAPAGTVAAAPRPPAAARRPSEIMRDIGASPVAVSAASAAAASAAAGVGAGALAALVPATAGAGGTVATLARPIPADERLLRHSIRREADRKRRVRGFEHTPLGELAFPDSHILTNRADAEALYLTLPLVTGDDGAGNPTPVTPATSLIWATHDGPESSTVESLMNAYLNMGGNQPTVLLVRAGGNVFGGYAADAWDFSEQFGGTAASFLFSLTRDVKIPYTGRVRGPRQPGDDVLRRDLDAVYAEELAHFHAAEEAMAADNGGVAPYDDMGRLLVTEYDEVGNRFVSARARPKPRPYVRFDAQRSSPAALQFGLRDLVLKEDLGECSSELENSFGVGIKPGSFEARTFLAGAPVFRPEMVELWVVSGDVAHELAGDGGSAIGGGGGGGYDDGGGEGSGYGDGGDGYDAGGR